jgi:hypothetical protein
MRILMQRPKTSGVSTADTTPAPTTAQLPNRATDTVDIDGHNADGWRGLRHGAAGGSTMI